MASQLQLSYRIDLWRLPNMALRVAGHFAETSIAGHHTVLRSVVHGRRRGSCEGSRSTIVERGERGLMCQLHTLERGIVAGGARVGYGQLRGS